MISLLYLAAIFGALALIIRYAPKPPDMHANDQIGALFWLGFICFGGFVGWVLPELLHEIFHQQPPSELLMRLVKVIGAICGAMILWRGLTIWIKVWRYGLPLCIATGIVAYIFDISI